MKPILLLGCLLAGACVSSIVTLSAQAADPLADKFLPLFNGRDLTGWTNVNCAPETWSVRDGIIHCTGQPTGALRTLRHYENFVFELEWRHLTPGGNAGIFIWASPIAAPGVPFLRSVEVQVLDNGFNIPGKDQWYTTHGDIFPIHGSTMKPVGRSNGSRSFPSSERSHSSPEWNHYRITGTNGVLRLSVNGQEVTLGEDCNYRKGYIGLESEGAPVEFRNLRIHEFPATPAPETHVAPLDGGWSSLFNGLDLRGWKTNSATATRWRAGGNRLATRSGVAQPEAALWCDASLGDVEVVFDARPVKPAEGASATLPSVWVKDAAGQLATVPLEGSRSDGYQRFYLQLRGGSGRLLAGDREVHSWNLSSGPGRSLALPAGEGAVEFMNLHVRTL